VIDGGLGVEDKAGGMDWEKGLELQWELGDFRNGARHWKRQDESL
jgi:hypothetical protein